MRLNLISLPEEVIPLRIIEDGVFPASSSEPPSDGRIFKSILVPDPERTILM